MYIPFPFRVEDERSYLQPPTLLMSPAEARPEATRERTSTTVRFSGEKEQFINREHNAANPQSNLRTSESDTTLVDLEANGLTKLVADKIHLSIYQPLGRKFVPASSDLPAFSHPHGSSSSSLLTTSSTLYSLNAAANPTLSSEYQAIEVSIHGSGINVNSEGLYTGNWRVYPVSETLRRRWESEVQPRLCEDLHPVLRNLPQSLAREQTAVELELCMAGAITAGKSSVNLVPTIWIRCGSKECAKVVKEAVETLNYLKSISYSPIHVGLQAPNLNL